MAARVHKNLIAHPLYSLFGLVVFFGSTQVLTAASGDPWIEGAKKEGEVILYASMNLEEANAMISRFEQKYPFVKVS
jgi:hypothetical protein